MKEFLITLDELNEVEEQDEDTNQLDLFGNIVDFIHQCPICKERRTHLDWWTCKPCGKLPIKEYTEHLIKIFGKK